MSETPAGAGGDSGPLAVDRPPAGEALQECQRTLDEVQEIARIGVWRHGVADRRLWWSDGLYRLFGLEPGSGPPSMQLLLSRIHADDREVFEAQVEARRPFRSDYRVVLPNGEVRHVHEEVRVEYDDGGAPCRMSGTAQDVTDRARMEERLRASESRVRAIIDSQAEFVVRYQPGGTVTFVNDTLCRYTGLTREALVGKSFYPFMHPEDRPALVAKIEGLDREHPVMVAEVRVVLPDGRVTWHQWTHHAIFAAAGELLEYQCTGRDVTDRRAAQEELAGQRAMLQQVFDTSGVGIFRVDRAGRITEANRGMAEMFGRPQAALIAAEYQALVHPAERDAGRTALQALLAGERPAVDVERRYLRADGTEFWGHFTGRRFRDAPGREPGAVCVITDVTERRRAEDALRKNERMLQGIIDAEPECVKLLDAECRLIFMNRAGLDMIQAQSLDQVRGRCVCPMIGSEHMEAFRDLTRRVFLGESGVLLFEMTGLKGRRLWLETHAVPLRDEQERIVALMGVTRDVTERKLAEEALRASELRFRSLIENASVGILVADAATGKLLYANPSIRGLLGYGVGEFAAFSAQDLAAAAERPASAAAFRGHAEGRLSPTERTLKRKDGSTLRASISSVPMEIDGRPCLVGFFADLTERQLLEEERLKAQKLESVGTLAGGIAHDFNNLLQGVFGYISLAKHSFERREQALAMLEQAEKALHQSVSLTTQLLTFSKGGRPVKTVVDLRPLVENAVKFALSGSRATAALSFAEDLRAVEADEGQIAQVVQNLVLNAEQAMPLGGRVEVGVRNARPSRAAEVGLPAGTELVEIAVRDEGVGIPAEHLPRIFDPYFSTKQKGSGLGLATSYSIVKNHHGAVTVDSVPGKGTTFSVFLPAAPAASRQSAVAGARAPRRACRVLVMDDEEVVRAIASELLAALAHEVTVVADGTSALAAYAAARAAGKAYDVVILDLTIRGGMGGEETLRRLRELDPAVRAVVSSGYSDDGVAASFREYGFRAFLKKPYSIDELSRALAEALD